MVGGAVSFVPSLWYIRDGVWPKGLAGTMPSPHFSKLDLVPVSMAKQNFEESLEKLEQITREMEEGNLSLEASLKKFDEGMKLADFCSRKLDEAQKRIDILINKDGALHPEPFADHIAGD